MGLSLVDDLDLSLDASLNLHLSLDAGLDLDLSLDVGLSLSLATDLNLVGDLDLRKAHSLVSLIRKDRNRIRKARVS